MSAAPRTIRLETLIGRLVHTANNRPFGHIEEIRSEHRDGEHQITEYLLGSGALIERWSLARNFFGRRREKRIVKWNQLDISNPRRPRLTCSVDEIEIEKEENK